MTMTMTMTMKTLFVSVTMAMALLSGIEAAYYCTKGYVMDTLCITGGNLFDNPNLTTLAHPFNHSVMCMMDIPACLESGFQILVEPDGYVAGDNYTADVILDEYGNNLTAALARELGECSNGCTGSQKVGMQVTVVGQLASEADLPGSDANFEQGTTPPILLVTEVLPVDAPCPAPTTTMAPEPGMVPGPKETSMPTSMPTKSDAFAVTTVGSVHMVLPMVFGWIWMS